MNNEEIKFIDRIYRDLYLNDSVIKHTTSKSKYKRIKEYIEKLEEIHNGMINHNHIDTLKRMYYDKYVIKEEDIPNSYYEHEQEIALERGYGHIVLTEESKKELNRIIINDQKKSLDTWLDYFLSEDSNYIPFWAKYWAFQGMLRLGNFDKEKGKYTKRSKHTITKFADINREALALSIDYLLKYLNKEEINDKELEGLIKSGSFGSIYTYIITKVLNDNKNITKRNEGKWIKYNKGTDHMPLVKSLEGKNTGWCTAGESTAKAQLQAGDFYVYYTLDDNDEYTIPRIAMRMEENKIGEIRGVAEDQNLEPEMEEIVASKIKDFPDKDEYYKKVSDMEKLTIIYRKNNKKDKLSSEELRFLYEIDSKIEGFGYEKDPRIDEIKMSRRTNEDLSIILNVPEQLVASNEYELNEETVVYYGNLNDNNLRCYPLNLKIIIGNCSVQKLEVLNCLNNLEIIIGNANFKYFKSVKSLENLKEIGGSAYFDELEDATGLKSLEKIGSAASFSKLSSAKGLEKLKTIGGYAEFPKLESAEGLENLETIGGSVTFSNLKSSVGLSGLKKIGGSAFLGKLKEAEHLKKLKEIGGTAYFDSLETAKGLENLETIGGNAAFYNLESSAGPSRLKKIGKLAFFKNFKESGRLKK